MTLSGSPGLYYGDEVGMTGGEEPGSRGAFPWQDEDGWDRYQLETVRSLAAVRRSHPALRGGTLEIVSRTEHGIAFVRSDDSERLLIAVDRREHPGPLTIPATSQHPEVIWGVGRLTTNVGAIAIDGFAEAVIVSLGPPKRTGSSGA